MSSFLLALRALQLPHSGSLASFKDRGLVRHRLPPQIDAHKLPHHHRVAQRLFQPQVRQVEPLLQEVHSQHPSPPRARVQNLPYQLSRCVAPMVSVQNGESVTQKTLTVDQGMNSSWLLASRFAISIRVSAASVPCLDRVIGTCFEKPGTGSVHGGTTPTIPQRS